MYYKKISVPWPFGLAIGSFLRGSGSASLTRSAILVPKDDLPMEQLYAKLCSQNRDEINRAVAVYLNAPSVCATKESLLLARVRGFMFFVDMDSARPYLEKMDLKILFFKTMYAVTRTWSEADLGALSMLGFCQSFICRPRIRELPAQKEKPVVKLDIGRLFIHNQTRLGVCGNASVKTGQLTWVDKRVEEVAIKRINLKFISGDLVVYEGLLSAIKESLIPLRLGSHPNIMPVYAIYLYDDAKQKKLRGMTLREDGFTSKLAIVMPKAAANGLKVLSLDVSLSKALRVLVEAAKALAYIESSGHVYNDFKLENILIFEDDSVKLGDFGLTYKEGASLCVSRLGGTYPSPEAVAARNGQTAGIDFSKLDTFSFGVVLFVLLNTKTTYRKPIVYRADFKNSALVDHEVYSDELKQNVHCPANPVVGFLRDANAYCLELKNRFEKLEKARLINQLILLVQRCLRPDPAQRPSMGEVLCELETIRPTWETSLNKFVTTTESGGTEVGDHEKTFFRTALMRER